MKPLPIVAGIALFLLVGCSHAPVANPVDLAPAVASVDKADSTLTKAIQSHDQKQIVEQVKQAKVELQTAKAQILSQQHLADQLAATRDWWKNDSQKKDAKVASLEDRVSHLSHLLFLCSALISIVAGGIGWSLFKDIPYGAWITGGIVITTFTSAWFALGHLL